MDEPKGRRLYVHQSDWLEKMRRERSASPDALVRAAVDFYIPIYEALQQGIPSELMAAVASAVKMSGDANAVTNHIERFVLELGGSEIAAFPAEVRREVRQHARKLKRERRVAGSR